MPYPAEHRPEIRRRVLDSARKLFNRRGLTEVSIDEVMAGAGLTRGGFYSYFASKEELYAEAITHFLRAEPPPAWQCGAGPPPTQGPQLGRAILDAYLSREHFDDVDGSCPIIALSTDVARSRGAASAAYRQVLAMMTGVFAETMSADAPPAGNHPPDTLDPRERALALAALCVGGMVLARAVDDPAVADDLRAAAHRYGVALAGWSGTPA